MRGIAIFLLLAASAPASAQLTRVAAPNAVPPPASVKDFAWLEGQWTGEGFNQVLHESYSAPMGPQMVGHFYAAKDGMPSFYEFELITQVGNSVEFWVRHFNPDMTAWEDKSTFVRFPLVAVEKDTWFFDGLTIRRTGPDSADHIVRVKRKDGASEEAVLHYRRTAVSAQ